jgi:hypothetical protein
MRELANLLRPFRVEHLQVLFYDSDLLFLMSLIEVLQDDGDVHVDDDHEVDDDEGDEEDDGDEGVAAVAVWKVFVVVITIRRSDQQWLQDVVPASRSDEPLKRIVIVTLGCITITVITIKVMMILVVTKSRL